MSLVVDASVAVKWFVMEPLRAEATLRRLRNYIETNPLRWDLDRENPGNGRTGRP